MSRRLTALLFFLYIINLAALPGCDSNGPVAPGGADGPPEWVASEGVASVVAGECAITVYWGEAIDYQDPPVEYLVYMDSDSDPFDQDPIVRESNDPFTFTNLGIAEEYWFGVRCEDSANPPHRDDNSKVVGARTRDLGWAQAWGGPGFDKCSDVAVDSMGNVYATGYYEQSIDFDPGPGEDIHTTDGEDIFAIFLVKYSPQGEYQWARTWGGKGYFIVLDWGHALDIDPDDNIVVTGEFAGNIDFDPGPGEDFHASKLISGSFYGNDAFVSKFDPDGNYLWGRNWSVFNGDSGEDIACDSTGNVYVLGESDSYYLIGSVYGTCSYTFLRKLDSFGNLQWQLLFGQDGSHVYPGSVIVDNLDNVCLSGYFHNVTQIDLDPGTGEDIHVSAADHDCFLIKLDSSGVYQWGQTWGGSRYFPSDHYGLASDAYGNIFVVGSFLDSVDFDPGDGVDIRTADGTVNPYVCKYSPDGQYEWVQTWTVCGIDSADSVVVTSSGNICVSYNYFCLSERDCARYALRMLDAGGTMIWEQTWTDDIGYLGIMGLCGDIYDNIYIAGGIKGNIDMDPGPGEVLHANPDPEDGEAFVMKLLPDGLW